MRNNTKRATIYIDSELHHALRIKAAETERPISELVNEAIKYALLEDSIDLSVFEQRRNEQLLTFEEVLKKLKKNGKI